MEALEVFTGYRFTLPIPPSDNRHLCLWDYPPKVPTGPELPQSPGFPSEERAEPVQLDCVPFADYRRPAGDLFVQVGPSGVDVEGWAILPATDDPVKVRLSGAGGTAEVLADRSFPASADTWPGFSTAHGFHATLPYAGTPGSHPVCVSAIAPDVPATPIEIGCTRYQEAPYVYLEERAYRAGEPVPFHGETFTPGVRLDFNVQTAGGSFLWPWRSGGLGTATIGPDGHVSGTFQTSRLPPGAYRLAYTCVPACAGLNVMDKVQVTLADGQTRPVAVGPVFSIETAVAVALTLTDASDDSVSVAVGGLQPGQVFEVVVVAGLEFHDGMVVVTRYWFEVGDDGRIEARIDFGENLRRPYSGAPPRINIVYLVDDSGHAVAAGEFRT